MALRRKGSAPWSLTKDTGLSDAPVSGSPFVEGDEVKPVINAGFIDATGLWQINPGDDLAFTFQDPSQAIGPGADVEFPVNMLKHDILILALLDASGNDINVDIFGHNPTTPSGPYAPFQAVGVNGNQVWRTNKNTTTGAFYDILWDNDEGLTSTWEFLKISDLRGTQLRMIIHNNDGSNAGTISTAYMRLV